MKNYKLVHDLKKIQKRQRKWEAETEERDGREI